MVLRAPQTGATQLSVYIGFALTNPFKNRYSKSLYMCNIRFDSIFTIVIADLSIDLFIVVFCLINLCTYVMADFELCMKKILKKSLGFVLAQGAASSPIIHIYRISNSIKSKRKKNILKISFRNNHKGVDAKEESTLNV
uniref:Uncharacterized protein n=1 Tax=Glossina pallidipes TaxID=7398 RepID=A0A1A9ZGP8_GLOPL